MRAIAEIEALARLHLRNRFLWLALGLALYLIGQLSYWQLRFERFDTLTLMAHLTAVFEAGLLAAVLIVALSTPRARDAWVEHLSAHHGGQPFDHLRAAIAGNLVVVLCAVILLAPILVLHRYPELVSEDVNIPLMMLQRGTLLLAFSLVTYHVILTLRLYFHWAWGLCALLGLAWHVGLGYWLTWLSFTSEFFRRLNDVFYYNQLWLYSDAFPNLQRPEVFHNIEQPFYAYSSGALFLWLLTLLLLVPGAVAQTRREPRRPAPGSEVEAGRTRP